MIVRDVIWFWFFAGCTGGSTSAALYALATGHILVGVFLVGVVAISGVLADTMWRDVELATEHLTRWRWK